jgi:hypothetical protein
MVANMEHLGAQLVMVAAGSIRVDMSRPRMNLHTGEHLATKLVVVANMEHLGTQLVMVATGSIRVDTSRTCTQGTPGYRTDHSSTQGAPR